MDFSNNRAYALAWVATIALFVVALSVNLYIQGAYPRKGGDVGVPARGRGIGKFQENSTAKSPTPPRR